MFRRRRRFSVLALAVVGFLLVPASGFGQVPSSDYILSNRYDIPVPSHTFPLPDGYNSRQATPAPASVSSSSQPQESYQASYPAFTNEAAVGATRSAQGNVVHMNVLVPESGAQVWFDGSKTSLTGTLRQFVSPPLDPGHSYSYVVEAKWLQNGRAVDQKRTIHVRSGDRVSVDFNLPAPNSQPVSTADKTATSTAKP